VVQLVASRRIRADCGTENTHVAQIQRFLRRKDVDRFAKEKSFIYGKSVANQRIEAWWSIQRRWGINWWINYFKDLRDRGNFPVNLATTKLSSYSTLAHAIKTFRNVITAIVSSEFIAQTIQGVPKKTTTIEITNNNLIVRI
jgi:hypothetical protein